MEVFVRELVKKLDVQRPDWRQNTILLFDGASYHTSAQTQAVLRDLDIPVIYLAPYSYNVAPCELWFGHFKSDDINP